MGAVIGASVSGAAVEVHAVASRRANEKKKTQVTVHLLMGENITCLLVILSLMERMDIV